MREFFRGWRRKSGLGAVVMAMVFAGLWARSLAVADTIMIGPENRCSLVIVDSGVVLWCKWGNWKDDKIGPFVFSHVKDRNREIRFLWGNWLLSRRVCQIPLYAFVLSSVVISLYLLISKPRRRTRSIPAIDRPPV